MEKISVRLLVLAAAIVAPALIAIENDVTQVKHVEEISSEELKATVRVYEYCAYSSHEAEQDS
jgi:hypothetical protein